MTSQQELERCSDIYSRMMSSLTLLTDVNGVVLTVISVYMMATTMFVPGLCLLFANIGLYYYACYCYAGVSASVFYLSTLLKDQEKLGE